VVDVRLTSPNYFEVTYPSGVISFQMYFKGHTQHIIQDVTGVIYLVLYVVYGRFLKYVWIII